MCRGLPRRIARHHWQVALATRAVILRAVRTGGSRTVAPKIRVGRLIRGGIIQEGRTPETTKLRLAAIPTAPTEAILVTAAVPIPVDDLSRVQRHIVRRRVIQDEAAGAAAIDSPAMLLLAADRIGAAVADRIAAVLEHQLGTGNSCLPRC